LRPDCIVQRHTHSITVPRWSSTECDNGYVLCAVHPYYSYLMMGYPCDCCEVVVPFKRRWWCRQNSK